MRKTFLRLFFVVYCGIMLWLLFGQRMVGWNGKDYWEQVRQSVNLRPLGTLKRFWWVVNHSQNAAAVRHALINLLGNVVMFIPLGAFLPAIFRKKCRKFFPCMGAVVLLISLVELVQLLTLLGSCDVDDLILNTLGALLGYIAWLLFRKT